MKQPKPNRAEIERRTRTLCDFDLLMLAAALPTAEQVGPAPLGAVQRFDWSRQAVAAEIERRGLGPAAASLKADLEAAGHFMLAYRGSR